jgi:hypothetical protein
LLAPDICYRDFESLNHGLNSTSCPHRKTRMLSESRPLVAERVESLVKRRGLGPGGDPDAAEAHGRDEPGLAAIYSASIRGRIASGPRAGNRVMTVGDQVDGVSCPTCPRRSGGIKGEGWPRGRLSPWDVESCSFINFEIILSHCVAQMY